MPYKKGQAASLSDLLTQVVAWVTDADIHGEDAWTVMRNDAWPRGTIFKAKNVDGENSAYIGILPLNLVKGITYKSWLFSSDNIGRQLIWPPNRLNLKGVSYRHTSGATTFSVLSNKYDASSDVITYTFSSPDIVNVSCTALVFGVFKQYADELDWHEQPGGIELGELGLYPLTYTRGSSSALVYPPAYPGIGYPGIGMPDGEPSNGYFDYWLTKDASRLTVVTNNAGQWDIGHAGMLVPFQSKMQYAFPAVIAGSNNGLRTINGTYNKIIVKGAKIDYSYSNFSMSRSLPVIPTINTSGKMQEVSNLALCLPDGKWNFFHNFTQQLKTNSETIGENTTYWFTVEKPVIDEDSEFVVKPMQLDLTGVAESLTGEDTVTLEPFDLVQNSPDLLATNMLGSLWRMAWPGLDDEYGEVTVNGKACLILPNCWKDRMWYVPSGKSGITDQTTLLNLYTEILDYSKQFRMLIRLED